MHNRMILLLIFRLVLAAYFLFLAVGFVCTAWLMPHLHTYVSGFRLAFIALSMVYALGARTAWRERASMNSTGTGWPMTASLVTVLWGFGIPAMVYFWGDRSNFWQSNRFFAISSAVGVCGLIVFHRRRLHPDTASAA